ncbi:MAG TPA: hypothetical protein PKK56_02405 [archaeon]|nr:hypothetical protein [archaeon]
MISKKQKINFIIYFCLFYTISLILIFKIIGQPIMDFEINLIKNIFGNTLNYTPFLFAPFCSGLVGISIYLTIIFSLGITKIYKIKPIKTIIYTITLYLINIIRLIIVLLSEKINIEFAQTIHVISWFIIGGFILWFVYKN